jgi:hypothetical protein
MQSGHSIAEEPGPTGSPARVSVIAAAIGLVIVLPLMLICLMFGLTNAIPVWCDGPSVAGMEEERGAASGWAKLLGNFLGGFVAVAGYYLLQIAPTLATLAYHLHHRLRICSPDREAAVYAAAMR